jgi:hypothetical protein
VSLFFIFILCKAYRSRVSSGSIVSDYGLDDRAIGVRSPAGAKDFSSNLCIQTGSEVHPASCTMGTGGPFPGAKRGRGVTLITHPLLVPRSRMSRSYTSCPPHEPPTACSGTALQSLDFLVSLNVSVKSLKNLLTNTVSITISWAQNCFLNIKL